MDLFSFLRSVRASWKAGLDYVYDYLRYLRCSRTIKKKGDVIVRNEILILSHAIEKGLSLPEPRPGFGEIKVLRLIRLLENLNQIPENTFFHRMGTDALAAYSEFHEDIGHRSPVADNVQSLLASRCTKEDLIAGTTRLDHTHWDRQRERTFSVMAKNRHSVRVFSMTQNCEREIEKALNVAMRAPAQCNRQSSRVHLFVDREKIKKLLEIQGGAAGFMDQVPYLAIITNSIDGWNGGSQRNQPWVDGSLFAMSFMYALENQGLASCPLNLALGRKRDHLLHKKAGIPESEIFIMMLAIGQAEADIKVAKSSRIPLDIVRKWH